jgi:HEXXH motif-containing protein
MAEAIVHETQHGKLNLLSWLDPVLRNGHSCFTESPVRPDPRPLMGVLLALHAFVPVAALHRALAEARHPVAATERFARRRAEVIVANGRSLAALRDLAEPTANGRLVLEGLAQLHAELLEADQPPIESSTVPP